MNNLERVASKVMAEKVPEKTVPPTPVSPDEETKRIEAPAPKEPEEVKPDLPEQVKRTQKLIEAIHAGRELRGSLVAAKLRRGVEVENELRLAEKDRDERLFGARRVHEEEVIQAGKLRDFRVNVIESAFDVLTEQRQTELAGRGEEIAKLDKRLEQLCKQLDTELAKMGAKVPA
jgi:hypothetical protein